MDGVKVDDIARSSVTFIKTYAYQTPYSKAPEVCIEIVSPPNSQLKITEKVNLYLAKGAMEVWIIYDDRRIHTYSHIGEIEKSEFE